jgi:hypothetical protein
VTTTSVKTMTEQTNLQALCAEQLPELRGMFERILCVARSSDGPTVGHIQLADQLIDAVVSWSENSLAQAEPEGVELPQAGTVESADAMEQIATETGLEWNCDVGMYLCSVHDLEAIARAVLTHFARPTIEPVPVAEDVPHEEILRLAAEEIGYEFTGQWFLTGGKGLTLETNPLELLNFAHAILARWGRPAIEPVPVAERPWEREGWCDRDGFCWWGRPSEELCDSDWYLGTRTEVEEFRSDCMPTVSLPCNALPLPTTH